MHRVLLQWALRGATLGKAVTGLRAIRELDGGRPTPWDLVRQWFTAPIGVVYVVGSLEP